MSGAGEQGWGHGQAERLSEWRRSASAPFFKSFDDIVDHCCYAWNKLIDQPWKIMSIARRDWAGRSVKGAEQVGQVAGCRVITSHNKSPNQGNLRCGRMVGRLS